MASNTNSTPTTEDIELNLDTLEREQVRGLPKAKPKPFAITFEGKRLVFADPIELPAPILMTMEETPDSFFGSALSADDYDFVMDNFDKMPGWKLQALMQRYQAYYGLDGRGNGRGSRR